MSGIIDCRLLWETKGEDRCKTVLSPKMHTAVWQTPHDSELCLSVHRSWALQRGHSSLFGDSGEPTARCLGWWSRQTTCLQISKGVCSIISCKCCMKERRASTIPGFSGPYKFSTCFHWVVQYLPRMSRCVWGTVNSNKWRHGDNHGKSMVKRANTISLLAGAK